MHGTVLGVAAPLGILRRWRWLHAWRPGVGLALNIGREASSEGSSTRCSPWGRTARYGAAAVAAAEAWALLSGRRASTSVVQGSSSVRGSRREGRVQKSPGQPRDRPAGSRHWGRRARRRVPTAPRPPRTRPHAAAPRAGRAACAKPVTARTPSCYSA